MSFRVTPEPSVGILTAALQWGLTTQKEREEDPDLAVIRWLEYAEQIGADCIQLSAAVPAELLGIDRASMLDPTADHLRLDFKFDEARVSRILEASVRTGIRIASLGCFENLLDGNFKRRDIAQDYLLRVFNAAHMLGVPIVAGFVGRNADLDLDQNLKEFGSQIVPLLECAVSRNVRYDVEHCSMRGWNTTDSIVNNIFCNPFMWASCRDIAAEANVAQALGLAYDPSHNITDMPRTPREVFRAMSDMGITELFGHWHIKGQQVSPQGLATFGPYGQLVCRGDREDGEPYLEPTDQLNAWAKYSSIASHALPGAERSQPLAAMMGFTIDWPDMYRAASDILGEESLERDFIVEHEMGDRSKMQDPNRWGPVLAGSIAFTRAAVSQILAQDALWKAMKEQLGLDPMEVDLSHMAL